MDLMTVANKVEEELQKKKMVGDRIGSGFNFQTNTRNVQYMYGEVKDTEIITNTIKDVVSNFEGEFDVSVRYKKEDFTFYISLKEQKMSDVYTDNSKVIENLQRELEKERNLNAEIKARFVKCNTCTPDMKDKCPMFHENLCEGERCEELVDLMSLVEKRDNDDKIKVAKDIIKRLIHNSPDTYSGTDIDLQQSKMFAFQNAVNEGMDFLKEE